MRDDYEHRPIRLHRKHIEKIEQLRKDWHGWYPGNVRPSFADVVGEAIGEFSPDRKPPETGS